MKKKKQNVVLGVTGSIAAYKAAELASLLVKQGHDVFVVMTKDATEFITPLTLQTLSKNPVTTSFYDEKQSWHPGHIALADRADLLVIAPATAHIIAELAHGLAGHPLAAIALATRAPILLAPAMNGKMWEHSGDEGKCGNVRRARCRIHRTGSRDAGLRLRRSRPLVESRRDRVSRRVPPRAPG